MTFAFSAPPIVDSVIARIDPRWKLAAAGVAMACIAALQHVPPTAAGFVIALLLALVARLPAPWVAGRLGALALALLPFAIVMPLVQGAEGAQMALLLSLKALTIVTLVLVVLGTTSLPTLLNAMRALGLPAMFVHVVMLSYRYIFVLGDEADRFRRALRVRGFRPRTNRQTYQTIGHVIGTLLVRGGERAESVARAMRSRGFDGTFRSLAVFRTAGLDLACLAGVVAGAGSLLAWDVIAA